jgi:hypothetical protein
MLALLPMGVFADKSTEVSDPVLLGIFKARSNDLIRAS